MAIATKTWLPWVILLVGLGGGLPLAWNIKEEFRRRDHAEPIDAWEEYRDAMVDRDFDAAWNSIAGMGHHDWGQFLRTLRDADPKDPEDRRLRRIYQEEFGLDRATLLDMSPRDFFIWYYTVVSWDRREDWNDTAEALEEAEPEIIRRGDHLCTVRFTIDDEWVFNAKFNKVGDRWYFWHGSDAPEFRREPRPRFDTLERKVPARLPPGNVDLERIALVFEAVSEEPSEAALEELRDQVEALGIEDPEASSVVLEVPPEVSWGGVLQYCDVLWDLGIGSVYFSQTAGLHPDEEESGSPTCFLDLDDPDDMDWAGTWWPDAAIRHPSIPRIIGMPVWQAYWLEFNLKHLNR